MYVKSMYDANHIIANFQYAHKTIMKIADMKSVHEYY